MKWLKLATALMVCCAAPMVGAGEIERIQGRGEIVVSLNRDYPPFSMETAGRLTGIDVDLALLLAETLRVKTRFIRPETYDQQIPKLLAGESDIIMAAMTRTVARGLQVNFTDPYFEVSQAALAVRERLPVGADSYFDLVGIAGLRLGVKTGTTHETFARELFPGDTIHPYPTVAAAAGALVEGRIDALVADSPFVRLWRRRNPEHYTRIAALLAPVTREHYAFAVRRGDPDWLTWLNLFVAQVRTDGTLALLRHEYFDRPTGGASGRSSTRPNRAQLLRNRFMEQKKERIEARRKRMQGAGDAYE